MDSRPSREALRRKAIDDLYAAFASDVVLEAEVEAILGRIGRIVALDAVLSRPSWEALASLPAATCYRTHTQPDEHLGVAGAVWIADVERDVLARVRAEMYLPPHEHPEPDGLCVGCDLIRRLSGTTLGVQANRVDEIEASLTDAQNDPEMRDLRAALSEPTDA